MVNYIYIYFMKFKYKTLTAMCINMPQYKAYKVIHNDPSGIN